MAQDLGSAAVVLPSEEVQTIESLAG